MDRRGPHDAPDVRDAPRRQRGAGTPLAIIGDGSSALSSAIANDAYMLKTITTSDLEVADTGAVTQD